MEHFTESHFRGHSTTTWTEFCQFSPLPPGVDSFYTLSTPGRTHFISILTLEITIFGLEMMLKCGLDIFYFEILQSPSLLLALLSQKIPGAPFGWILWAMTFYGLKKFTSKSFKMRIKLYFEHTKSWSLH